MRKMKIIIFAMLFLICLSVVSYSYTYTKHTLLPPMKMTYNDINELFKSLRSQFVLDGQNEDWEEEITISGSDVSITKEKDFTFSNEDRLPEIAHNLSYYYRNREGKISTIRIELHNYYREITLEGSSPDNIDALNAFLLEKFQTKKIFLGGQNFKFFLFMFFLTATIVILGILGPLLGKKTIQIVVIFSTGVIFFILGLVSFLSDWFPGFSIYKDNVSLIIRNSAQFTFWGFILGIIFFVINLLITFRRNK